MGTSDGRRDQNAPGGVGTIARPAAPSQVPPRQGTRPRAARPAGSGQAERTRRVGGATVRRAPESAPHGLVRPAPSAARRMPFILLLCGLLGGALISALVISTTLAAGSFQITRLQQANNALARQRQILQEQVAAAQSAQVIQERALKLGMRPVGELRFLNLKTGKVQTDAGSGAVRAINVPGYTP